MTPIQDVAITLGMNTVDDKKVLKPGECVRLLNAFPGNPPVPRNGCTGVLMTSTTTFIFVPPGISFNTSGAIYVIAWVYDSASTSYKPLSILVSDGTFTDLGNAEMSSNATVFFDFLELHSCIYASISQTLATWKAAASALGHKVFESNLIVRDMCIAEAGSVTTLEKSSTNAYLKSQKWFEYSFQFVRHTNSTAWEAGTLPSGMILPYNITSSNQPKRMDTFLPGVCIGVELPANRKTVNTSAVSRRPTAGMLTNNGFGHFDAAKCVDLNVSNTCFDADTGIALGSNLVVDYTTPVLLETFVVWMAADGGTNEFMVQCSSNGTNWIDASLPKVVSIGPTTGNQIPILESITTAYRYWRLYLNNAGADGPDVVEIDAYGKCGVLITLAATHATALAQGATHLRVSRCLEQDTKILAQGATKFFLCDLPLDVTTVAFSDTTSNAALEGETNQLITGYSVAPPAAFMEYLKGRLFMMATDGRVYFSESVGGDGGTDLETAQAYPQAWASLFKPTTYLLDCDYVDGQRATGMKRLGDDLFMFKERKIFAVFGGDPTSTPLSQVSNTIGCAFPYTLTKCEIKGMFGKCLLFLGNDGPMVMEEGGRVRPFSEFKIKELWPEQSQELYSELDLDYDWISRNCTAAFFKNTWWIMYKTKTVLTVEGTSRIFGYYFDPDLAADQNAPHGPLEFQFAEI
jgi:hypothetical protein